MIRRWVPPLVALLALLLGFAGCSRRQGPPAEGMNLLLVTLDTTRADHISPLGGDPRNTPVLTRFAEEAATFTAALSESNVTAPSHLTILSGLPALRHGVMNNRTPLPEGIDTLAETLERSGYATAACVAVRQLSTDMAWRGFASVNAVEGALDGAEVNECALAAIERFEAGRPFFLWVHYFDAHSLYSPPRWLGRRFYRGDPTHGSGPRLVDKLADSLVRRSAEGIHDWLGDVRDPRWPRAMYAAEIADADRHLGEVLASLDGAGERDRTVVVVTADHGESLGDNDVWYSHSGLYESILRIPLFVRVPGWPARRIDAEVTTLDIVPTVEELFGVDVGNESWGSSLVPLMTGSAASVARSTPIIHQWAHNNGVAVRRDGWKLIWPIAPPTPRGSVPHEPLLFDLAADPLELSSVAASHPERVEELRRFAQPWIDLGQVKPGETPHLDAAALDHLRALGYVVEE